MRGCNAFIRLCFLQPVLFIFIKQILHYTFHFLSYINFVANIVIFLEPAKLFHSFLHRILQKYSMRKTNFVRHEENVL